MIRSILTSLFFCIVLTGCSLLKASKTDNSKTENRMEAAVSAEICQKNPDTIVQRGSVSNNLDSATSAIISYFSNYMKTGRENITHLKLYRFIDNWMYTPFKLGGSDKYGIDCSTFIKRLIKDVYELNLPGTSIDQLFTDRVELFRSKDYLSEGDIIFFRLTPGKKVSHVGIYLQSSWFVHASRSRGVTLSALTEPFWKTHFVVAGRIKANVAKK